MNCIGPLGHNIDEHLRDCSFCRGDTANSVGSTRPECYSSRGETDSDSSVPDMESSDLVFIVSEEVTKKSEEFQTSFHDKTREILMRHSNGYFVRYICFCKFHSISDQCHLRRDSRIYIP